MSTLDFAARKIVGLDASATTFTEQASVADSLVDSVGVNVHLNFLDTPYNNYPAVKAALLVLGVRHLRDSLVDTTYQPYYDEHNNLGTLGIKSIFITSVVDKAALLMDYPKRMSKCFEGYENPNEDDNKKDTPNWANELRTSMELLSQSVRPGRFPVYGPALVHSESYARLGDVHKYFDFGNLHNYPGGNNPGTSGWGDPNARGHSYGGMAWQLDLLKVDSPGLPFVTTETGYTNDLSLKGRGVPEQVSAVYLPRLILHQWNSGAKRTYLYELVSSLNEDFGLLRSDFTPKPGFQAVSNLLMLLSDPGPAFQPQTLSYHIKGGAEPSLSHALFQKRDGSFYLALWLEKSSYDVNKQTLTPVSAQSIELEFASSTQVTVYQWDSNGAISSSAIRAGVTLPLSVSDRLTVVKIRPHG